MIRKREKEKVVIKEVEQIVTVPKYVTKEIEIIKPRFVEKEVISAKIVTQIVPVTQTEVKIKHIEEVVRVPKIVYEEEKRTIIVPVLKEKDVIVQRPKFVDKVVEIIKPKYVCQKCGHEVT